MRKCGLLQGGNLYEMTVFSDMCSLLRFFGVLTRIIARIIDRPARHFNPIPHLWQQRNEYNFFSSQVWFQNRRAKFRKTERMTHNSAASKNSNDDSSGTRTPGSPENEKSDGDRNNDINVESIKEEKVSNIMSTSPMEQMNKEGKPCVKSPKCFS